MLVPDHRWMDGVESGTDPMPMSCPTLEDVRPGEPFEDHRSWVRLR